MKRWAMLLGAVALFLAGTFYGSFMVSKTDDASAVTTKTTAQIDSATTSTAKATTENKTIKEKTVKTTAATTVTTTEAPTTVTTTEAPTTVTTTEVPTTEAPTTLPPTEAPTTEAPTTLPPTEAPTTEAPTTLPPTEAPTTEAPTTVTTTAAPTTEAPTTTAAPTTVKTTKAPTTTPAPTTVTTTQKPTTTTTKAPVTQPTCKSAVVTEKQLQKIETRFLEMINAERASGGAAALTIQGHLDDCAQIRSQEIMERWEHTRPNGESFATIVDSWQYSYTTLGENICTTTYFSGYYDETYCWTGSAEQIEMACTEMFNLFKNSPGHYENFMKKDYEHTGVGISIEWYEDGIPMFYVTQLFGAD